MEKALTRFETLRKRTTDDTANLMMTLRGMSKNLPDARTVVGKWLMLPPGSQDPRRVVQDLRPAVHDDKMDGLMTGTRSTRKEKAAVAKAEKKALAAAAASEKKEEKEKEKKKTREEASAAAAVSHPPRGRGTKGSGKGKGGFDGNCDHCGKSMAQEA